MKFLFVVGIVCLLVSITLCFELIAAERDRMLRPFREYCFDGCICCQFHSCYCQLVCPDGCQCYLDVFFRRAVAKCSTLQQNVTTIASLKLPKLLTETHLDGLNIPIVKRHDIFAETQLKYVFLNKSNIKRIEAGAFKQLPSLQMLNLDGNYLTEFRGDELINATALLHLHLANNSLQKLDLEALYSSKPLRSLTLSGNPWACGCDDRALIQTWLPKYSQLITDLHKLYCISNTTLQHGKMFSHRLESISLAKFKGCPNNNDTIEIINDVFIENNQPSRAIVTVAVITLIIIFIVSLIAFLLCLLLKIKCIYRRRHVTSNLAMVGFDCGKYSVAILTTDGNNRQRSQVTQNINIPISHPDLDRTDTTSELTQSPIYEDPWEFNSLPQLPPLSHNN